MSKYYYKKIKVKKIILRIRGEKLIKICKKYKIKVSL